MALMWILGGNGTVGLDWLSTFQSVWGKGRSAVYLASCFSRRSHNLCSYCFRRRIQWVPSNLCPQEGTL